VPNVSITQARFTSQLRTWILVAALTALLIGIGALIGGKFLYIFVVFAVLMNVAGYWFSDKIALTASRAKPVSEQDAPQLYKILRDLTARARLPMPRVYIVPSEQPNAFATGRDAKHSAVAVTEGLMRYLPEDQIRGVLAHELSHVKNHDILVTSVAAMIAGAIAAVANILQFSFLFGGFSDEEDSPLGFIGALATIILAPIAAAVLQMAVSRQREFLADATGARLLGTGKPLADALETLERGVQSGAPLNVNPATASLYIVHPFRGQSMANLFSTHPPLEERIRRLHAYDASQGLHYG
jgi:heat shock protein HtpX